MRHGEAEHNVAAAQDGDTAYSDPRYKDAPLTAKGREQVLESARKLAKLYPKIDYIWSSPLTRAIQTARCVLEVIPCENPILLSESLTECQGGGHICNERLPMPMLQDLNPDVDAKLIQPYYYGWTAYYATNRTREDTRSMLWRAHSFINTIQNKHTRRIDINRPLVILIVSHHETLNAWLGKSLKNAEFHIGGLSSLKTPTRA